MCIMLFMLLRELNPNLSIDELYTMLFLAEYRKGELISLATLDDIRFKVCIDVNPEYTEKYCLSGILRDDFIIDGIEFTTDIDYTQYKEFSKELFKYTGFKTRFW